MPRGVRVVVRDDAESNFSAVAFPELYVWEFRSHSSSVNEDWFGVVKRHYRELEEAKGQYGKSKVTSPEGGRWGIIRDLVSYAARVRPPG